VCRMHAWKVRNVQEDLGKLAQNFYTFHDSGETKYPPLPYRRTVVAMGMATTAG
jgi:hypothetical protein